MAKLWLNSASRATLALLSLMVLAPQAMALGANDYQSQQDFGRNDDFRPGRFDGAGNGFNTGNPRLAAASADAFRHNDFRTNVNITGALRSERGDWTVVDALTGNKYELQQLGGFTSEPWFRVGTQVEVTGTTLRGIPRSRSNAIPLLVKNIERAGRNQERITVMGLLKRSFTGGWTVTDNRTNTKHFLLDIDRFENANWFRPNTQVQVEGRTRRPLPNVRMEGSPLSVITIRPLGIVPPDRDTRLNVSGVLKRSVTAGGWTVTDKLTNRKFVLLNIEQYKTRDWFRANTPVFVEGVARPNVPNIYMEGVPLAVTLIRPAFR